MAQREGRRAAAIATGIALAAVGAGCRGLGGRGVVDRSGVLQAVRLAAGTRGRRAAIPSCGCCSWPTCGFRSARAGSRSPSSACCRARPASMLAIGATGGLIIGMITRTALGHTGRMLIAGRIETAAYALVLIAALVRVLTVAFHPAAQFEWRMPLATLVVDRVPALPVACPSAKGHGKERGLPRIARRSLPVRAHDGARDRESESGARLESRAGRWRDGSAEDASIWSAGMGAPGLQTTRRMAVVSASIAIVIRSPSGVPQRVGDQVRQGAPQHQAIPGARSPALAQDADPAFLGQRFVKSISASTSLARSTTRRHARACSPRLWRETACRPAMRDALVLLQVRGEDVLIFGARARPRQRHLGLRHQVGDRRAQPWAMSAE